jgi:biotin-[acetyl-CoA-carboxylase] ligase BirA-like protein
MQLIQGFWRDTVDSTQDEARRLVKNGSIKGLGYVLAGHQSKGRGTQGRQWDSPENKGLYLSIVHQPLKGTLVTTPLYPLLAGVSCAEALYQVFKLSIALKPINDLYYNNKKLGGILIESDLSPHGISTLISGIGINLYGETRQLDRGKTEAVSLEALLPEKNLTEKKIRDLQQLLVERYCFWVEALQQDTHQEALREWSRLCLKEYTIPPELEGFLRSSDP